MASSTIPAVTQPVSPHGPFKQWPGSHVLEEFRTWVRETGQPDTWRYHDRSKPPRDRDFEEVLRFQIPHSKRPAVGMASCPV